MSRYIDEADRSQGTLLPEMIDEYVAEEKPVRVIEAFVEALDLASRDFSWIVRRRVI